MKISPRYKSGMSLIEVAVALGIVAFCAVAILGMIPVILDSVRTSRQNTAASRMLQTVEADVQANPPETTNTSTLPSVYKFDRDGFLADTNPQTEIFYEARLSRANTTPMPGGEVNSHLVATHVVIYNVIRNTNVLERSIWTTARIVP